MLVKPKLLMPKPYYLFNNITLETDRGTTQIDHVLITPRGIFVVETKDYSIWIYGSPDQRKWTQVHFKKKTQFLNPLDQNAGHIKALKKLFNLPDNHFHNLIVFTGSAEFKTDLGPNVIQLSQLSTCLTQPRPVIFDETKMTYIVGRIEMNRLPRSRETDEYHINYVRSKLN